MNTVKRLVAISDWEGGVNRWSPEDFSGSENTWYDTITIAICPYTFVQTRSMCNTKRKP